MEIKENIPLSSLTTLRIGGPARHVVECFSIEDIREAVRFAKDKGVPLIPFGQGSNVLASDEGVEAVVALIRIPGLVWNVEEEDVLVEVGAGVSWDSFVQQACERNLWGIENLAGIPGTVGASPVQNIGAYGSDVSQSIISVDVYDTESNSVKRFSAEECTFGYRDSIFKHRKNLIITAVCFKLGKLGNPHIEYADLTKYKNEGGLMDTPTEIAIAVRSIRSKKFPDLSEWGTAGSFFKNPTLSEAIFDTLKQKYPDLPGFRTEAGIKVPLAWILDHVLMLRGYTLGHAFLFHTQPLVLVASPGASAKDVEVLAKEVSNKVFEATGITIEREVRSL